MASESVTDGEIEAFMTKLSSVDFTDKERSMLRGMMGASVGEVEGFDNALSPSQRAAAATPKTVGNWWTRMDLTPEQDESLYGPRT